MLIDIGQSERPRKNAKPLLPPYPSAPQNSIRVRELTKAHLRVRQSGENCAQFVRK